MSLGADASMLYLVHGDRARFLEPPDCSVERVVAERGLGLAMCKDDRIFSIALADPAGAWHAETAKRFGPWRGGVSMADDGTLLLAKPRPMHLRLWLRRPLPLGAAGAWSTLRVDTGGRPAVARVLEGSRVLVARGAKSVTALDLFLGEGEVLRPLPSVGLDGNLTRLRVDGCIVLDTAGDVRPVSNAEWLSQRDRARSRCVGEDGSLVEYPPRR